MENSTIEVKNIIEEPVVKRGRGRPRVIKKPKEPEKRERPIIERPPTIPQNRWRKPILEQRSNEKNNQRNARSSLSWMYQIY